MLNFNVAVPFPSGACGSLGCHSVASPLAAVAARGAEGNINDDVDASADVVLEL